MKINGSDLQTKLNVYQIAQVQGKQPGAVNSVKPKAPSFQLDRVALSERGRTIADAQQAMAFVPDIRESLVVQIQTDLKKGAYIFDYQKAAEGILRESMVNQAAMM